MDDKDAIAGVQLDHFSNKNPLVHADDLLDEDSKGGGGNGGGGRHKRASPGAAHSRAAAFKKTSSLLSSFGFSKSGSTGLSKGEGGGKSAASRNASFQRASKVRNKR